MANNYILLQKVTVTSTVGSVSLSNIPTTGYTDLKLVVSAIVNRSNANDDLRVTINNNTSATYSNRRVYGTGNSTGGDGGSGTGLSYSYIGVAPAAGGTSSIYSNTEYYFPNYRSSAAKSYSADGVAEYNSSTIGATHLNSGFCSDTNPITIITIDGYNTPRDVLAGSTFYLYGIAAVGTTPTAAPFATGGDLITNDGTYWIHTFLSSGIFTPTKTLNCDYLVVAGGGGSGGGNSWGGTPGGGAGGYRSFTAQSLTQGTSYNAIIGAGGAGAAAPGSGGGNNGANGTNSIFNFNAATGGGASTTTNGNLGGSGAGAYGYPDGTYIGGAGNTPSTSPSQGNNGGLGKSDNTIYTHSGGGGGAGQVGGNATTTRGGLGGNGVASSITGTSTYYAGGGGGGAASNTGTSNAAGGLGGGGAGKYIAGAAGDAGTVNTGGGAGGSSGYGGPVSGAAGGSGIVIIRYPMV
jgi:hypothetical protein